MIVACHPFPLPSCCSIFLMPSSLLLLAYTASFSCTCYAYILINILIYTCFSCFCILHAHKPHPFASHGHVKSHMHNNEEMVFIYTEIYFELYSCMKGPTKIPFAKSTSQVNMNLSCKNEGKYLYCL